MPEPRGRHVLDKTLIKHTTLGSGLMSSGFTAGTSLALGTKVAKRPPRGACNLHSDARQHTFGEHLVCNCRYILW